MVSAEVGLEVDHPKSQVFEAAAKAVSELGWRVVKSDESRGTIEARIGAEYNVTWGEIVTIIVSDKGSSSSSLWITSRSRLRATLVDGGRNKANLGAVLSRLSLIIGDHAPVGSSLGSVSPETPLFESAVPLGIWLIIGLMGVFLIASGVYWLENPGILVGGASTLNIAFALVTALLGGACIVVSLHSRRNGTRGIFFKDYFVVSRKNKPQRFPYGSISHVKRHVSTVYTRGASVRTTQVWIAVEGQRGYLKLPRDPVNRPLNMRLYDWLNLKVASVERKA